MQQIGTNKMHLVTVYKLTNFNITNINVNIPNLVRSNLRRHTTLPLLSNRVGNDHRIG